MDVSLCNSMQWFTVDVSSVTYAIATLKSPFIIKKVCCWPNTTTKDSGMRLSNIYLYLVKVGSIYLGIFCCRLEVVYAFLLSMVYSTHVEKSTFNLAWLTDIMGQTSGEGCIYIFRNSHKICIPLGQSKMLILLWQVLPSIKWNLLGQSLLWKNLHEQSLLAQ